MRLIPPRRVVYVALPPAIDGPFAHGGRAPRKRGGVSAARPRSRAAAEPAPKSQWFTTGCWSGGVGARCRDRASTVDKTLEAVLLPRRHPPCPTSSSAVRDGLTAQDPQPRRRTRWAGPASGGRCAAPAAVRRHLVRGRARGTAGKQRRFRNAGRPHPPAPGQRDGQGPFDRLGGRTGARGRGTRHQGDGCRCR